MSKLALCDRFVKKSHMTEDITCISVSVIVSVVEKLEVMVTEKANGVSFLVQIIRTHDGEIVRYRG